MSRGKFTVGVAQVSPRLGDVGHNLAVYEDAVREARGRGVDLVVFPELSLTGYALRDLVSTVALRRDAPEIARLAELSRGLSLVAGIVEEAEDYRFYNSAVYFEGGHITEVHRKVYLPTYGMFDEQRYFARGSRVRAFDTRFGRFAMLVCEDLWHSSTAYLAALDGATVIVCPSASPLRGVSEHVAVDDNARYWELLNTFYTQTFGLFLVYANRVGFEDGAGFWGGSEIVDPFAERLARARYYEADFITTEISQEVVRRKRIIAPLLRDEDVDLTINELLRLRGRPAPLATVGGKVAAVARPRRQARQRAAVRRRSATDVARAKSGAAGRRRKQTARPRSRRR